jgi:hypothetical protein
MPPISNLNIDEGRSFTESEDEHSAHVAIVGADVVDNVLGPATRSARRFASTALPTR